MSTAISIRSVTKQFGSVVAVDGVNLDVREGDFVTLVGPSGCGKTTLLRMVAGLEGPTSGEIEIFGRPVFSSTAHVNVQPHARGIGMVFQSYALWPHMSAFDNVAFPLRRQSGGSLRRSGISRSEERRLVMQALGAVHCEMLADRYPGEMSGGQQQRVALARAIVASPQLVLMDEPLSNLDAKLRARLRFELRRIQQDLGFTALYVTHDRGEALSMSDVVVVLQSGHIEQQGSPETVYERPATPYVSDFLGDHNVLRGRLTQGPSGDRAVETVFGAVGIGDELARGLSAGACVDVAVPRGGLSLSPGHASDAAGSALVAGVAFCGWYSEVLVRAQTGEEATVRVDGRSTLRLGDPVQVTTQSIVAIEPLHGDHTTCDRCLAGLNPGDGVGDGDGVESDVARASF